MASCNTGKFSVGIRKEYASKWGKASFQNKQVHYYFCTGIENVKGMGTGFASHLFYFLVWSLQY